VELKTADGKVYYQDNITKTTQWGRPSPPKEAAIDSQLKTATCNSTPSHPIGGAAGKKDLPLR